jgi:capsid portal protein
MEDEFPAGHVYQVRESDADQAVYDLPEWMPAVQSALLNESATLFRRK